MTRRRILIDTDPGHDDAMALLLALASPDEIEVLAVTTVAGNVPLERTTANALKVLELAGRTDVPVVPGSRRPLVKDLFTAEYIHGKTGMDGPELPDPATAPATGHGVDRIVEVLRAEPAGTVTVCTLGPMTNLAAALQRAPDVAPRIARVVAMGGGVFEGGNVTPAAEFNIFVDPHAADVVFRSGVPITLVPLDTTHRCLSTRDRIERFRSLGTRVGQVTAEWLDFFERFDVQKYGSDGGPLHDPCVIAWLIRPALFQGRDCNVTIETASPLTVGMTVTDWWQVTGRPHNAFVTREVDADGYFDLLTERIGRL
jgi:purine nucleosidase